jgi:hypothetical protein
MECAPQSRQLVKVCLREGKHGKNIKKKLFLTLIQELESGKKLGQLSRENNIHPNMISRWKLEYDKDPESVFKGNGNTYKDAARSEELERLVGKLYAENDFLKKALGILEKRVQEEKERLKAG